MKDAKENSSEFIKFYLVGNKTDLEQKYYKILIFFLFYQN